MKKILLCFSWLLFISAAVAQNSSSGISILIKSGKVSVNKKDIAKDWSLQALAKVLGAEDRIVPGKYNRYVYEKAGIVIMEKTDNKAGGVIAEVQLYADATDQETYTPKEFYEGVLKVEELIIDKNTSIQAIRASLRAYAEKEMSEAGVYRFSKDGVYILFRYDSSNKLQKLSFGPEK